MQLFAIIAKQDGGTEISEYEYVKAFLVQQLNDELVQEYLELFIKKSGYDPEKKKEEQAERDNNNGEEKEKKKVELTSVKDSVRILGLCKKINKTLTQKQKVVVLTRLFELVNADRKFTEQRMAIINTVAEVFKIPKEEIASIDKFVLKNEPAELEGLTDIIVINDRERVCQSCKHLNTEKLDTDIFILRVPSVDLYFLKYTGAEDLFLNGLPINNKRIYLFANGSTVKLPKGKPIYYSDIVSQFMADISEDRISFNVEDLQFKFPNGELGLRDINFSESEGRLVGIMGASGAGKTTLLNVLCGINSPSSGSVKINGIDIHHEKEQIEGVIGYIPQDDLLIEELTVYQNLYYNAKLCFRDKSEEEINELVDKTLMSLGLYERKDLKVGSPLNKLISGGQRKRLNIALELIREPSILFVDEPTSGLSSRDSENVMDLLRELALKGKLILVVIHQPSSEIFKMFDRMIILDTGGYMVYYGNPVQSVIYFKTMDQQVNSDTGECPTCGNVNPELLFNVLEAKVVDEFGRYTNKRKVSPQRWAEMYDEQAKLEKVKVQDETPPRTLKIPGWFKQFRIYTIRDFLSKISNTQYIALNLLEAPLLGFILSYIIRYIADPESDVYIFRENENIPPYIFMAIVVALFLGLTVSAEEIFRDRKILKREKFLNLSRSSYLVSKILILFSISAIQAFLFIIIGNSILDVQGMLFEYWFALFTIQAFANMLGLNISASFNSAVTIYILIPMLMIPQMILGGAMFSFDKLNRSLGTVGKVPWAAETMAARWVYEALMVHQFKENNFERHFYTLNKYISIADYKQVYYLPELEMILDESLELREHQNPGAKDSLTMNMALLRNELTEELKTVQKYPDAPEIDFEEHDNLNADDFNASVAYHTKEVIKQLNAYYSDMFLKANNTKEENIAKILEKDKGKYQRMKDAYENEALSDYVKKVFEKNKILRYRDKLVQNVDPIYQDPRVEHYFNFRTHFYAPKKHFMGTFFDTYWFNVVIVWLMTIVLYITLYYEHLLKLINAFEKVNFGKIIKKNKNFIKKFRKKEKGD